MIPAPLGMLAELTHACPLHCPYCSNPVALAPRDSELSTQEWDRVFGEAAALGVVQAHLSGGEPLLRRDLDELVASCGRHGLYTNLITSGLGLDADRLARLPVDHVQISVQDATERASDDIAGTRSWARKITAARVVKDAGRPLTLNVVLHRANVDHVGAVIALAGELGADRLELAHTQYYGWALRNRAWLMPSMEQVLATAEVVRAARTRMEISYVLPDLHTGTPKPCTGGWGRTQLTVAPGGEVRPCAAADSLPLEFANVRDRSLDWIWYSSPSFNRFRGTDWMPDPCRSCALKDVDLGGCRCQAFQLTGDPGATDPVCRLSPDRHLVDAALAGPPQTAPFPRPHAPKGPSS
ncbi:coenzyme PQQ synthesis protein E [Longispora fulva]|uniref:PqqA peptide cyclase n=1 Tax=Longispora fulva TaxID=619741 RepID=A0A8J7GS18_9ACTN|nr:pyrroloquinoline quinone biosynthesis protein PqqE [Longispora fulva]MBG6137654.1 pyrroloquinoline quinone biosynthesis protein E [Longispora fulva]GIG62187.1 coenzyme PQQ synthesis protein E [Longispora fulva]